jgi:hypothetical protein
MNEAAGLRAPRPLRRGVFVSAKKDRLARPSTLLWCLGSRGQLEPYQGGTDLALDRGHQACVAARSGRVDASHPLGREARDIMWAAGLGARAA